MDVVLVLHSHLPYVLHHGRWPHGSDWLCEAAIDSYLPILETLLRLRDDDVPAPLTLGFTPILTNQLIDPAFLPELTTYFEQRDTVCAEAPGALVASGDQTLVPLAAFWRKRYARLRELCQSIDGDLIGAFRALEAAGRIEIIGSAATHALLPLLGRDESIALQLRVGSHEHRRLFGRAARGCWLPECAYRPGGRWRPHPGAPASASRPGIEHHLTQAGFQYFVVDAHMARAGRALELYGDAQGGRGVEPNEESTPPERSPYLAYRVGGKATVLVRDPIASRQVWSRYQGYPGDEHYLEFHKIRWPGGLRLWRVSAPRSGLGEKLPYRPESARHRAAHHGRHFVSLLADTARHAGEAGGAIVAPFDTELFGHWWFEGPDFLGSVFQLLARPGKVRGTTASAHLEVARPSETIELQAGSWGANGDFSMWLNPKTEWTWQRLWKLEDTFWSTAPPALADPACHFVLAQAAREMLLAQSSDWQFIITTGAAADYAEKRFIEHCDAAESLVAGLSGGTRLEAANRQAAELARNNPVFPDVLEVLREMRESGNMGMREC